MRKAITLITAAAFGASGVAAQPPVVVTAAPFKVVSYADLNISSEAGQTRLTHRIRAAASDLCLEDNREEWVSRLLAGLASTRLTTAD